MTWNPETHQRYIQDLENMFRQAREDDTMLEFVEALTRMVAWLILLFDLPAATGDILARIGASLWEFGEEAQRRAEALDTTHTMN